MTFLIPMGKCILSSGPKITKKSTKPLLRPGWRQVAAQWSTNSLLAQALLELSSQFRDFSSSQNKNRVNNVKQVGAKLCHSSDI